jgi:hypothetical protein
MLPYFQMVLLHLLTQVDPKEGLLASCIQITWQRSYTCIPVNPAYPAGPLSPVGP